MIVRNVEKAITECLASIVPYVNEVIIVDTGSTDQTKTLIKAAAPTATILDFTPDTHPNAFAPDTDAYWGQFGIPGPFSNKMMLTDFGAARQFGWEKATSDYLIWIDSDDMLENGQNLAAILNDMAASQTSCALINYDYASDAEGRSICKLVRERIVARSAGSRWNQPIHETVGPTGNKRLYREINIRHRRYELNLPTEINHRNLKVLSRWWQDIKDTSADARVLFYLASEQRYLWPDRALNNFNYYCSISGWDEERALARLHSGKIYESRLQYDKALQEFALASIETPWNPETWFCAARIAYFKRDWSKCIELTQRGIEARDKPDGRQSTLMHDPADRFYRPLVYYSVALIETGNHKHALEVCNEGLKWSPSDPHLKGNKELLERLLGLPSNSTSPSNGNTNDGHSDSRFLAPANSSDPTSKKFSLKYDEPLDSPPSEIPVDILTAFAIQLWKHSHFAGLYVKAFQLIQSLPEKLGYQPKIRQARDLTLAKMDEAPVAPVINPSQVTAPSTLHSQVAPQVAVTENPPQKKLHIIIWTGPSWEQWTPDAITTTGIGGSETAAICLARELVKLGHRVTALADCGYEKAGFYDGVQYVHFQDAVDNPQRFACDIYVVSRQPHAVNINIPRKATYIWAHDIHVGEPSSALETILRKVDKFFCLSNWHKGFFLQTYPFLNPKDVIVTANGLDLAHYQKEPIKVGNRLIYASSPDRGLERLLQLFPKIREQVPDAELHIFYGFYNWKKMAQQANNRIELEKIARFEALIEAQKDKGVTYHGRVPEPQLAKEFAKAKVWAYPSWFTETYCITALMAQASGCIPVTTELGALPETVSHGFIIKPPITSPEYERAFIKRVVCILKNEKNDPRERPAEEYATAGRAYTLAKSGWDKIALDWQKHFTTLLESKDIT
jgi:glycosyltransferase involved in cell wall biosynthesis